MYDNFCSYFFFSRYLAAVVVKGFKVHFDLIPHFNTTTGNVLVTNNVLSVSSP